VDLRIKKGCGFASRRLNNTDTIDKLIAEGTFDMKKVFVKEREEDQPEDSVHCETIWVSFKHS